MYTSDTIYVLAIQWVTLSFRLNQVLN